MGKRSVSRQPAAIPTAKREFVALFVPNVIGYVRLLTCAASCLAMASHPVTAIALYSISALLDALDGYAARILDQGSRYGAVLDMVLDRLTTLCLHIRIAVQLPYLPITLTLQFLASLDLASHYAHMYASLLTGHESHKKVAPNAPWMLRWYYESKVVLFWVCLFDQWAYIAAFLLSWVDPVSGTYLFSTSKSNPTSLFSMLFDSIIKNLTPFLGSAVTDMLVILVEETGSVRGVLWIVFGFSFVVCIFKQVVNVIQLVGAANDLIDFDIKSRAKGKRKG